MIPKIASRGTSFKGAGLYYLHDKREEGERIRTSSERVAWTDTRNLATQDPDFALRVMAATAMDKDRLKAEAGIKNTGNKSKGDVFAYSLAWHPDEQGKFDKGQMLEAADQSLKALGAQKHQAVIIAHQDEKHPHLHVIVNMVHPDNGKNLALSNDRKKLNKWSNDYRKARGEEHLYCPKKAKKFEAIEDKKRGHNVPFMKGQDTPRQLYEAFKAVKDHASQNEHRQFRQETRRQFAAETYQVTVNGRVLDLNLSQYGAYQQTTHRQEWHALKTDYRQQNDQISKDYFAEKARAKEAITSQMKPAFAEAYSRHREQVSHWRRRDKHLVGKLHNAIEAVQFTKALGRGEHKNFIQSLFNALVKVGYREQALKGVLDKQLSALRKEEKKQIKESVTMLNTNRKGRLSMARGNFDLRVELLKGAQQAQQQELQGRWNRLNDRRNKAVETLKTKGRLASRDEALLSQGDKITAKRQFQERADRQHGARSRSRKRKKEE